jgi:sec-independent protein translocase protein TatA
MMGMGGISIWQLLIILVIVLLIFGTKRLTGLGSDLGNAIKGFRSAMKDGEAEAETQEPQKLEQTDARRTAESGSAASGASSGTGQASATGAAPGADQNKPKV